MDIVADKSERVNCPFDPVHVIERRRLQAHIIKCKRNLPENHDFVQCQFWTLHYVRKHDLEAHYSTCEHALMKQATKRMASAEPSRFREPKLIYNDTTTTQSSFTDESWDIPSDQPTFTPEALRAQATHMTIPHGLTKSKRREYREQERKRLREQESAELLVKPEKNLMPGTSAVISEPNENPRKPEMPANRPVNASFISSTGSSYPDSSAGSSTTSNYTYAGPPQYGLSHQGMPPPHEMPTSHRMPSHGQMPSRGRGYLLSQSVWNDDARQSYHPYPYNGIPYRYSPDDFPGL